MVKRGLNIFRVSLKYIFIFILAFFFCSQGFAQIADTLLSDFEPIATFEDAISLSTSPRGSIYVVDRGRSNIHELNEKGELVRVLGGPGVSPGQFDDPLDIDPTNGLILVVADAGNGRIQRFSSEFLFLELLQVGSYGPGNPNSLTGQPRYRQNDDFELAGSGRPISVQTTSDNRMYVIDAEERVVIEWDQDRNIKQVIGEFSEGEGALHNPIDVTLGSDGSLYVLDADHESVRVYDAFGGYLRVMGVGMLGGATALKRFNGTLAVVFPGYILLFQERGGLEHRIDLKLKGSLVDVHYMDGKLYLLTPRTLYRYEGDAAGVMKLADL